MEDNASSGSESDGDNDATPAAQPSASAEDSSSSENESENESESESESDSKSKKHAAQDHEADEASRDRAPETVKSGKKKRQVDDGATASTSTTAKKAKTVSLDEGHLPLEAAEEPIAETSATSGRGRHSRLTSARTRIMRQTRARGALLRAKRPRLLKTELQKAAQSYNAATKTTGTASDEERDRACADETYSS